MTIQWLRRGAQRTTHAFRDLEITRFPTAMPLGPCGEFKMADLVDDPNAAKCVKCENAVRQLEREQEQMAHKTRAGGAGRLTGAPAPSACTIRSAA